MALGFTDTELDAVARAINVGGLTAVQVTDLARRGELAGLPAFDMAESTAREVAARARRGVRSGDGWDRRVELEHQCLDLLEQEMTQLSAKSEDGLLSTQDLTRLIKLTRAAAALAAPRIAAMSDHEPSSPASAPSCKQSDAYKAMIADLKRSDSAAGGK